jgi:hypothetical protein
MEPRDVGQLRLTGIAERSKLATIRSKLSGQVKKLVKLFRFPLLPKSLSDSRSVARGALAEPGMIKLPKCLVDDYSDRV